MNGEIAAKEDVWKREPSMLIAGLYSAGMGLLAIVASIIAELPEDANWIQVAFVAMAVIGPLLQGKVTRESVYSPLSYFRARKINTVTE